MNEKDEKRLCAALRRGDTAALEAAISAYSGYVYTVARNFSRGALTREDIDEAAADVFYRLWKYRRGIRSDNGLRAYLSAITRNVVKDRLKSAPPLSDELIDGDMPSMLSVESEAELREALRLIDSEVKKLPDDEREIFFRAFFYGEKCSETAKRLDMPENTVYTKLRRVRLRLKKKMTEKGF